MRREGQYLAVESVLTFGLGLMVAIGTVTAFSSYRGQMLDKASERQVNIVESRVLQTVQTLEDTDSGSMSVNLPHEIGSQSYTIIFSNGELRILLESGKEHSTELDQFHDHVFQGSTSGGPVKVFKRGDQFTLRAN